MHRKLCRVVRSRLFLAAVFTFSLCYFLTKTGLLSRLASLANGGIDEQSLVVQRLNAHRHIQWFDGENNETTVVCRNSRQGQRLLTDDRGYSCARSQLDDGGCCDATSAVRFDCSTCNDATGCCATYEGCVSCCLRPDQKSSLMNVIRSVSKSRLRHFAVVRDQWELCLLKCRTSSGSVHQENKYKNDRLKHCYALEPRLPFDKS